ncbi:MAG: ChaN family lipoprotein [Thermodesulfovibrionales bacterium]|nr:ChaN family lipoprotein [Thermodesulfovibrionales bacterium]
MNHRILNSRTNTVVEFNTFLESLKTRDIIYIGELHQIPQVLSFQMDVLSGLLHEGFKPAIGLEMFNVLQQEMLDYYMAGVIPSEQLSNLYELGPEGFDLSHYIKIIKIARKNRLTAIGLNVPRSIAAAVAKHGLDKRELECFHLREDEIKNCGKQYKKSLSNIYRKHPHGEISEENFILAQSIKDEMMAETIAHRITSDKAQLPFIVIAGRGHMEYRLGIPERVKQKLSTAGKSVSDIMIITAYDDEPIKKGMADYMLLI